MYHEFRKRALVRSIAVGSLYSVRCIKRDRSHRKKQHIQFHSNGIRAAGKSCRFRLFFQSDIIPGAVIADRLY